MRRTLTAMAVSTRNVVDRSAPYAVVNSGPARPMRISDCIGAHIASETEATRHSECPLFNLRSVMPTTPKSVQLGLHGQMTISLDVVAHEGCEGDVDRVHSCDEDVTKPLCTLAHYQMTALTRCQEALCERRPGVSDSGKAKRPLCTCGLRSWDASGADRD